MLQVERCQASDERVGCASDLGDALDALVLESRRSMGGEEEDGVILDLFGETGEQGERVAVGEMDVLEREQERLVSGEGLEGLDPAIEEGEAIGGLGGSGPVQGGGGIGGEDADELGMDVGEGPGDGFDLGVMPEL